jgi:hypothetical protein
MPTREEIERWLMEAGCLGVETDLWNKRAAQVAAMHCQTCKWLTTGGQCPWRGCGGCFQHEPVEGK